MKTDVFELAQDKQELENMLNEAAILAARAGRPKIIMEDIPII